MIKKIVDADNEAKAMQQAALKEKEDLARQIEAEADKIYSKYMKSAEAVVRRNDDAEEKKAKQQWQSIEKKQQSVSIKLKSDYQQNCDRWVDEIVQRTIAQE